MKVRNLLQIVTFAGALCASVSAWGVSEMFCAGEAFADRQSQGEKNYLVVMNADRSRYTVYEGMKGSSILEGELRRDKLFFYELQMGEYQSILRQFSLSRVTMKYHIAYTLRNGTFIESRGQCERYQAQI